jgi:hypothetical protein
MIINNDRNKNTEKGKTKGTSAFDIKQAESVEEISWSNNKFESTYSTTDNNPKKNNSCTE